MSDEGPRSREQRNPPSEPTTGAQRFLGWGCYVVVGVIVLAIIVFGIAFCTPGGGGGLTHPG